MLLEYLPYRKTESRGRRYSTYSYFVERGYVVARVDIRGTGNSEGRLIAHEYTDQENEDGEEVIAWLAEQSFSIGAVGMFGVSWGGFNAIHLAMRNPPALKAIIAIDATDDLYQDDVHFMDGILHVDSWEMTQDLDNAMPGAPDYVIDETYFLERFDTEPWMMTYKRQQRDGPFWDRTALKARYDAIRVPTFVIGGWYDGYRDSVPRMLEHVEGTGQGDRRSLVALVPARGAPRARHRVAPRGDSLVRSLAPRTRHRDHGRAALRGLHPALAPARPDARGRRWFVALGGGLADRAHRVAKPLSRRESLPRPSTFSSRDAPTALCAHSRHRGLGAGDVVGRRGARPAPDRRLEPGVRHVATR